MTQQNRSSTIGSLFINSTPSRAKIFLAPIGQTPIYQGVKTPCVIENIPIGEYIYTLRSEGFKEYYDIITILEDQTTEILTVYLIPEEGCIYFVTDPVGAKIFIKDIMTGEYLDTGKITPDIICKLPPGITEYVLKLPGYQDIIESTELISGQGNITIKDFVPTCIPNWQCEQPLNGYEFDGCGNRKLNIMCNPIPTPIPTPAAVPSTNIGLIAILGLVTLGIIMIKK